MIEQILEMISRYHTIIIHRHVRPDPDALGSQSGLAAILKSTFPEKQIYIVGEEDPALTFLAEMDEIDDDCYKGALVIVCDTANRERISDDRCWKGERLIKIDHHPNEDPYGDIVWVDTDASSVSEMIYRFYEEGKKRFSLQFPEEAARLLYAGIVGDTGRFMYSNTTPETFRICRSLLQNGFSFTELYEQLYRTKLSVARLKGHVLSTFTVLPSGAGYIRLSAANLEEYRVTPTEASQLVNAFSDVDGLKAWVFFIEERDQIGVRLRSKGVVVNEIAAQFDGGGHPLAAGASVDTWEETDEVLRLLDKACQRYKK